MSLFCKQIQFDKISYNSSFKGKLDFGSHVVFLPLVIRFFLHTEIFSILFAIQTLHNTLDSKVIVWLPIPHACISLSLAFEVKCNLH